MFKFLFKRERVSFNFRPKTISAGDNLIIGSGVLRFTRIALKNFSVSNDPFTSMLPSINRLVDLTASLARPFDCGWCAADGRMLTPYLARKSPVLSAINWDPPSNAISSGTPNVPKNRLSRVIRPVLLLP